MQELRDMGLDEDGNVELPQYAPHSPPHSSPAVQRSTVTEAKQNITSGAESPTKNAATSKTAERKMSNVEAKLREMDSPLAARLVESPYKAKATEKYPVKVANPLSASSNSNSNTGATAHAQRQRPSSSPVKRSEHHNQQPVLFTQHSAETRPHSSPKRTQHQQQHQQQRGSSPSHSRENSRSSAHVSDSDFALSAFRNQSNSLGGGMASSLPLQDLGSPVVGGAVKSSFLTDLGFHSADTPVAHEAYLPPRGVQPEVLVSSLSTQCFYK